VNRLSRVAFLITVGLGALAPVFPAPAFADSIGGVIVISGTGTDLTAMRLRTSAGCPAEATAFYAKMRGHGFPPDGQVTTANTRAGISHTIGFDVYVALIMRDYATRNHTTLGGRYDIPNAAVPPAPGAPNNAAQSLAAAPAARPPFSADAQPSSGADPHASLATGQLTSQRSGVNSGDFRWLVLTLVGAVLVVAGSVAGMARRARKRRSS
jgi:hypothetical protein